VKDPLNVVAAEPQLVALSDVAVSCDIIGAVS
jgi:hypothetical protein